MGNEAVYENLKYKDFEGSVEWCEESVCYHGKIVNTKDLIHI